MQRCEKKHIPEEILQADLYSRLEVIRGLMDSDGFIDTR
jgi:intein/homing endonuclease